MTKSAKGGGRWRGKAGRNWAVLDASPAELRRRLSYKATWHGSKLVVANRWFPSSKTCSGCKAVKADLPLSERTFCCEDCGLVIDRDLNNAAANLACLAEATVSSGTARGAGTGRSAAPANAQGEKRYMDMSRSSSVNCEDSTGQPGKTVTAAEQSTAA